VKIQQGNFSLRKLQDHMFHLIVTPKETTKMPLLSDILNFLHMAFTFILGQLKNFYDPRDKNIAFLTIFQSQILNGLNSGMFHCNYFISNPV